MPPTETSAQAESSEVTIHLLTFPVYHIHNNGWTRIHEGIDNNVLHYQFAKEKNLTGDQDEAKQRLF